MLACLFEDDFFERERADYVLKSAIRIESIKKDIALADQFDAQRILNKNLQHPSPASLPDELLKLTDYNSVKSFETY